MKVRQILFWWQLALASLSGVLLVYTGFALAGRRFFQRRSLDFAAVSRPSRETVPSDAQPSKV